MSKPYVMFGTHGMFGDYTDAIHANGGYLSRVIRNVPEPDRPPGQRFEDRLAAYEAWLAKNGIRHRVEVVWLENYAVQQEETPVMGFRGPKIETLLTQLQEGYGIQFPPLIHPTAYVSSMAVVHEGVFVGAASVVGPHVNLGKFSLLNRKVGIGHDTRIEEHVVVSPGVSVGSGVCLGRGCVVGIGATVIENLRIGEESYVAAGAVVLKDVAPGRMVAGVPAVDRKASPLVSTTR